MREILTLGNRIYHHRDRTDFNIQRLLVFWLRGIGNAEEILHLRNFFAAYAELQKLESGNAIFYEQVTRHVFYHQSTLPERRQLIERHFDFCRRNFSFPALQKVYYDERLLLWEGAFADGVLSFGLDFRYVDRKEGLMTLDLMLENQRVYHITFLLGKDQDGEDCLRIGALQGSLGGQENIHTLTKQFFGYRPKNLILYGVQLLAQELGIKKIYAVSNQGFFTNTHVRLDRKLKTSLDDFWQEAGGQILADVRFYELPLEERRKAIEDVKSQKRNLYRKRYALLDEIGGAFRLNLRRYLKIGSDEKYL